jgi:diaminopimelate epimerase
MTLSSLITVNLSSKPPKTLQKRSVTATSELAETVYFSSRNPRKLISACALSMPTAPRPRCANGARCAALFAHKVLGLGRKFRIETKAGIIHAAINAWTVEVQLTNPTAYAGPNELKLADRSLPYFSINTGVPHTVVILEEDFDEFPVAKIGGEVRFHNAFQPAGTNVNFIRKTGARSLAVRTYERGVEAETLACGTGSTASAIVAVLNGLVTAPVEVKTKSGEILKINFQKEGNLVSNVTLEGNAQFTFEGSLSDAI